MVIDYKNYSKGYKLRHRERHWGRYILPFLIIGLVFGGLYLWVGRQLAQGWHYAMQDKAEEARARFLLARKFYLRNHEAEDGLGVVELMCNNMTAARDHLLRGGSSAFDPPAVIAFFTARGQYLQAAQYGEYAVGWDSRPAVKLEQAVALIGIQKLAEADKILAKLAPPASLASRRDAIAKVLASEEKSGQFDFISDRANQPLVSYPCGTPPSLENIEIPGGLRLGGAVTAGDIFNHTLLTIDREYQQAAAASLGYPGGFVVIQPATGEILAAVSNPPPGDHSTNFALEGHFEPGSIIKLITLSAALRAGFNFKQIFPFRCTGMLDCDGRPFYDWAIHGDMKDIEQATAESCNIAFARIGRAIGRDALKRELEYYGFGRQLNNEVPPVSFSTFIEQTSESIHTARLAVGLEDIAITTLQGAYLAAALAGDGTVMTPRLIREKRTILQEPYFHTQATQFFSTGLAEESRKMIVRAMKGVVESETGTGRRVTIEGLSIALKTGTSGDRESGLDSVIIGFAPADMPRIAFCLYAHGAGKAEFEGVRILREFLQKVKNRL